MARGPEIIRYTGPEQAIELGRWLLRPGALRWDGAGALHVWTASGAKVAEPGDWIVRDASGALGLRKRDAVVLLDYTNWRGERALRRVLPISISFTESEYHPGRQWILHALDVEKGALRDFAMTGIHSWRPAEAA